MNAETMTVSEVVLQCYIETSRAMREMRARDPDFDQVAWLEQRLKEAVVLRPLRPLRLLR